MMMMVTVEIQIIADLSTILESTKLILLQDKHIQLLEQSPQWQWCVCLFLQTEFSATNSSTKSLKLVHQVTQDDFSRWGIHVKWFLHTDINPYKGPLFIWEIFLLLSK
jgi:hypothetical protein